MASDNPFVSDDSEHSPAVHEDNDTDLLGGANGGNLSDENGNNNATTTNNNNNNNGNVNAAGNDDDDDDEDEEVGNFVSGNGMNYNYLAQLLAVLQRRAAEAKENDNDNENENGNDNDSDSDDDDVIASNASNAGRALYSLFYRNQMNEENDENKKNDLDYVDENDEKSNVLNRRFKLRKGEFFRRKLGKLHQNRQNRQKRNNKNKQKQNEIVKNNNNNNNNSSSNSSNSSSVGASDVEELAYENYRQMYELSDLDKRKAQLKLSMETRNEVLIRSILPNLHKNIKLQFKNYKNYKHALIASIKEYEEAQLNSLQNITATNTLVDNNNNNEMDEKNNSNNNENTPMSMDENVEQQDSVTLPQSEEMKVNASSDMFFDVPSISSIPENNETKREMSQSPSSRLPAEKEIIPSHALPHNFNHFLQHRETMHSNIGYNNVIRHKMNDNFFANKVFERFDANSRIFCCDFSCDGKVLCLACQDHIITLIDCENEESSDWKVFKQVEAKFEGWSIIDVALAPDAELAAYSGWSENVCIVNTKGSHELHEDHNMDPQVENGWGRCCAFGISFDPDSQKIVAGWSAGALTLYDLEMKQNEIRISKAHTDDINTVTMCDRNLIVTGSDDAFVKVFDRRVAENNKLIGGFVGHKQGITCVSVPNTPSISNYILSNGKDQCMKLWDLRMINSTSDLKRIKGSLRRQTRGFDYRYNGFNNSEKTSKRMKLDNSLMTYWGHRVVSTLIRSGFSPFYTTNNRYVYCGSAGSNCDVFIYDILSGKIVKRLNKHQSAVRGVAWHPYQPDIVSASWDGTAIRWSYRNNVYDGQMKYGKYDALQEYLDASRVLTANSDVVDVVQSFGGQDSNIGSKINNYLKGGEWSDDQLMIPSDESDDEANKISQFLNDDDDSDDDDDEVDSNDFHYQRSRNAARSAKAKRRKEAKVGMYGGYSFTKRVGGKKFELTQENSNLDHYNRKVTSIENERRSRYSYY